METIYEIDMIKIEKEKAMRRYQKFRKLANIVRTVEVTIAIMLISIVISRISSSIPTVVDFSGVILRRLSSILFSPHFVFVISNVIVITLFANSSPSSAENIGENSPQNDDVSVEVDEVVEFPATEAAAVETVEERELAEKVSRKSRFEPITKSEVDEVVEIPATEAPAVETVVERGVAEKVYWRSQSEVMVEVVEKRDLRRSATVPCRKAGSDEVSETEAKAKSDEEEELSNEEFNRRVEEFIEKQRRFLNEESKILVLSN